MLQQMVDFLAEIKIFKSSLIRAEQKENCKKPFFEYYMVEK